jgi:hypothetical protein
MNAGTQLAKRGQLNHLKTLDDVVDDYEKRFSFAQSSARNSVGHDDPVVDFCKEAPSLIVAINRAAEGRRRDGKLFKKGSCVRTEAKAEMAAKLQTKIADIRRAKDFEQLYELVSNASPWGIGPMTRYAVTERIGAHLGIKPEAYLYLHAGPEIGWHRLMREKPGRVAVADLPPQFRRIELYHVENLLCEYRDVLNPEMLR